MFPAATSEDSATSTSPTTSPTAGTGYVHTTTLLMAQDVLEEERLEDEARQADQGGDEALEEALEEDTQSVQSTGSTQSASGLPHWDHRQAEAHAEWLRNDYALWETSVSHLFHSDRQTDRQTD